MTETSNTFVRLAAINVNEHVEKKGNLSYLSWAWAVDALLRADPSATWRYAEPAVYADTMMVFCEVTAFGVARAIQLPVMDHRNKPIPNPDAFQVNTAMQRCLVKAIALHGLGLYIYAGEDLPLGEEAEPEPRPNTAKQVAVDAFDELPAAQQIRIRDFAVTIIDLHDNKEPMVAFVDALKLDTEDKLALWSQLPSNVRSAFKKEQAEHKAPPRKPTPQEYASQP